MIIVRKILLSFVQDSNSLYLNLLVGHEGMLSFICDKTADPYFSNLVWFIGKHSIELDDCVTKESE